MKDSNVVKKLICYSNHDSGNEQVDSKIFFITLKYRLIYNKVELYNEKHRLYCILMQYNASFKAIYLIQ